MKLYRTSGGPWACPCPQRLHAGSPKMGLGPAQLSGVQRELAPIASSSGRVFRTLWTEHDSRGPAVCRGDSGSPGGWKWLRLSSSGCLGEEGWLRGLFGVFLHLIVFSFFSHQSAFGGMNFILGFHSFKPSIPLLKFHLKCLPSPFPETQISFVPESLRDTFLWL